MTPTEQWTVGKLLTWTTDYLKKSGSENPRLDAEVLLAAARRCERIMLYTAFEEVVAEEVRAKFRDLVKRRAEGAPVAYLVGKREFYSLNLRVTPDVLIPRPETEFVVIAALDALKGIESPVVADVGTGSGAIAIAIAKHAAGARVTAIDTSEAALAIARQNAADQQVEERIAFLAGDLLAGLPAEPTFDIIASNPPYVSEAEFAELSPAVRDHEPRLALVGGETGTEIVARLIPQAAERLKAGGSLILEISPMIAAAVVELFAQDGRFEPALASKDLAGLLRIVQAKRLKSS